MITLRRPRAAELVVVAALALAACADTTSDAEPTAGGDASRPTSIAAPTSSPTPADAGADDVGGPVVVERYSGAARR
ncbi:MAG: hypothetical protein HRT86_11315 [Ilumatobacteraceae bacterium]|nr:hypothetical protein [Ilumatobacteraceae bacterium]